MTDRTRLQEAITVLSSHRARFGETTIDTVVDVLTDRLAAMPESPPESVTNAPLPAEQRKQVTILFATIDGFTRLAGASHNTDRLQQIDLLWQRLDETIRSHGGVVDKHMGDVIMGIFGATVSHENDPERAVRCALALQELAGDYNTLGGQQDAAEGSPNFRPPIIRIGINTGQVSLGQVGSDDWLTAIGDAVNVASRLKESANEAGTYIAQDTHRLVRHLFRTESLGEFAIKGRMSPVTVYRVVGLRTNPLFPVLEGIEGVHVPMIGRDVEMEYLRDAFRRAAQTGQGEIVTIVGDAGVGKSRLAREFHAWLESTPFKATIFQARSDQRLLKVSYSLFHDLLVNHFGIEDRDSARLIEEKIIRGLSNYPNTERQPQGVELRERARHIARLGGLKTPSVRLKDLGRGESTLRPDQLSDEAVEYFVAIARRSAICLFFLEDIHWADDDSLALLERLALSAAGLPLLIICLARPTLFERRPDWGSEEGDPGRNLYLSPLSEADSKKLVFNILRKLPQIPPALSDIIIRSAGGNPFYVEEIIRVLIEDGVIVPDESSWQLRAREWTRLRVPATLTGVLQARLDRLPELERVTLQQAAIIGDEFWDSAVQQLNRASRHPFDQEQVAAALLSLEQRDMIYRAPLSDFTDSRAFLFRHSILREVAYESVLLRDRSGYHLQAARWLEAQSDNRTVDYTAPVAQHKELAGQLAEAARLYELAAVRATEQHKLGSAIENYRKVLDLLKYRPQELDAHFNVYWRLGRALQVQARMVEAMDVFLMMRQTAERDGNLAGRARAENAIASIYYEQGDDEQVYAAASRAEELARLAGDQMELAWAFLRGGQSAGELGRHEEAVEKAAQAVEMSRVIAAPRETARALSLLAALQARAGDSVASERSVGELAALASLLEEHGSETEAAFALARGGELNLSWRNYDTARHFLERALGLYKAGSQGEAADVWRLLGLAACRGGQAAEAVSHVERATRLVETTDNRYLRMGCRLVLAEALLSLEQDAAAEATLRQVIGMAEDRSQFNGWKELPHAYTLLVQVLNRQGRRDEARLVGARH